MSAEPAPPTPGQSGVPGPQGPGPQGPGTATNTGLLTVDDVCTWLKVSRDWVYDEVEAGRLPYVRIGRRHLRFRPRDLDDYIESHLRRPEPRRKPDPHT